VIELRGSRRECDCEHIVDIRSGMQYVAAPLLGKQAGSQAVRQTVQALGHCETMCVQGGWGLGVSRGWLEADPVGKGTKVKGCNGRSEVLWPPSLPPSPPFENSAPSPPFSPPLDPSTCRSPPLPPHSPLSPPLPTIACAVACCLRACGVDSTFSLSLPHRVSDPASDLEGRSVQLWLQQQGFEPATSERPAAATAAAGVKPLSAGAKHALSTKQQQQQQQQQQQAEVLRGLRLLMRGVVVCDLNTTAAANQADVTAAAAAAGDVDSTTAVAEAAAAAACTSAATAGNGDPDAPPATESSQQQQQQQDDILQVQECAAADQAAATAAAGTTGTASLSALPAQCAPESTFGAAWQLPATYYTLLLPTAANTAAAGTSSRHAAAAAGRLSAGFSRGTGKGSAGGLVQEAGFSGGAVLPKGKRARVLRDGQLTLIPYGLSEAELWGKRVHGFLGAVR